MYQKTNTQRVWLSWAAALFIVAPFALEQTAANAKPPTARKTGGAVAAVQKTALLVAGNGIGLPPLAAVVMQVIWGGTKDEPVSEPPSSTSPPPSTPPAPSTGNGA